MELKGHDKDISNPFDSRDPDSEQMRNYIDEFQLLTVTNYREFRFYRKGVDGNPELLEVLTIADSKEDFRRLASKPKDPAEEYAPKIAQFLKDIFRETGSVTISDPEDVAAHLAMHARRALRILEAESNGDLQLLRDSLEKSLDIEFAGKEQERLFVSTLVQTLFYGLFSTWVRNGGSGEFNWETARREIEIPVIQTLFEQLTTLTNLENLGIGRMLEGAVTTLGRINRNVFLKKFRTKDAIQHFYENFLAEMDPKMRSDFGVWYTPPEVVRYMVERVDRVLRTEMGCADGLADRRVYVLDPCCGTGAYLLEVLRKIARIHEEKNSGSAAIRAAVREAAKKRVFGFEIMTAPLVIANWQICDYLESLGKRASSSERSGRASVYLTNSLNDWSERKQTEIVLRGFREEQELARRVKQEEPILVMLGNPPYNAYATRDGSEEGLVAPYSDGLRDQDGWDVSQTRSVENDLYVKFIRIAERRIAESGIGGVDRGLVCYITNHSYLRGVSFPVMRSHLMRNFDRIWIDALNGCYWTNKHKAPDGSDDPSIFDTGKQDGIRVGTAIGLFCKMTSGVACEVMYRDFWGTSKREDLLRSLETEPFDSQYETLDPKQWNRFSFTGAREDSEYISWPEIKSITRERHIPGLIESRGGALFDLDDGALRERMKVYLDESVDWEAFRKLDHEMDGRTNYDAKAVREKALHKEKYKEENLVRCLLSPFDVRYAYHAETPGVWDRRQDRFRPHMVKGVAQEGFLVTRREQTRADEGYPVFFTRCMGRHDAGSGHSNYFALRIRSAKDTELCSEVFDVKPIANLSQEARDWVAGLGLKNPDTDEEAGDLPWHHALAITWSPEYLRENHDNLKQGWPRIPMPADAKVAVKSGELGRAVKNLLDTENGVEGVTVGVVMDHLRAIGRMDGDDLRLLGEKSSSKIEEAEVLEWSETERALLIGGFSKIGVEADRGLELLGPPIDVALNATTLWRGVPKLVWEFQIAGYQPVWKWISSRSKLKDGKALEGKEVDEFVGIIRRISALLLMGDGLDANYRACRECAYPWPTSES